MKRRGALPPLLVLALAVLGGNNASPVQIGSMDSWQPLQQGFSRSTLTEMDQPSMADVLLNMRNRNDNVAAGSGTRPSAPAFPPGVDAASLHSRPWSAGPYVQGMSHAHTSHADLLGDQNMLQLAHPAFRLRGHAETAAGEDYSVTVGATNPIDDAPDAPASFAPPAQPQPQAQAQAQVPVAPPSPPVAGVHLSPPPATAALANQHLIMSAPSTAQSSELPSVLHRTPGQAQAQVQAPGQATPAQGQQPAAARAQPLDVNDPLPVYTPRKPAAPKDDNTVSYDVHLYDANMLRQLAYAAQMQYRAAQLMAFAPMQAAVQSQYLASTYPARTGMLPSAYPSPPSASSSSVPPRRDASMRGPAPPMAPRSGFPLMHPFGGLPQPQYENFGVLAQYPPRMPGAIEVEGRSAVF